MPDSTTSDAILEFVQNHWAKHQKAALLAAVGVHLSRKGLLPLPGSRRLADFVREEMIDKVRVVKHPDNPVQIGLVPVEATLSDDIKQYFPPAGTFRFHPSIWAAFAKPISAGQRRFLSTARFRFVDASEQPVPAEEWREVPSSSIPPENRPDREIEVAKNVTEWLRQSGCDPTQFAYAKHATSARDSSARSVLDAFMDTLSERDLVRITMPLDIVNKLRRQKA